MISKKRGQITVFIIIGLIIVLTYFLLSYYKKERIEERELINPELVPVQQYVETCTKNLAREALDIIALNGGYIYFPAWIENNPSSYLASPIRELKNPFWWYDGKQAIPPLDFISKQISDYTKANMAYCLDNFSAFGNVYNIIELGNFDVITEIGEEDITIKTIYPIEVQDKFNKTIAKLQKYIVIIPIRLKKVYELATKIMERENKDFFIEKKAIDLIALDDDEIPTIGMEIRCGKKRWLLEKVENKLKQLLQVNLPFIKIRGTKFWADSLVTPYQLQDTNPFSSSNAYNESYYYHHYIWDVSDINYPNMHVSFTYEPIWDMKMQVRPSKGKFLESNPQRSGQIMSLLCFHIWHFTYDIIFPVKVTITDDKTDKNELYSFTFAFKAQINHNEPDRTNFAITSFDTRNTYTEEEYCADISNQITIHAKDKITNDNINRVNITFICGRYTCNMGQTEPDWDSGGIPTLTKKFPYCSNGIIRGYRHDYLENEMFIETGRRLDTLPEENIGNTFFLILTPIKLFNFTVLKHKMIDKGVSGAIQLEKNEKAMITIKNADENFESYGIYPLEDSPIKLLDKKDLDYDLEIFTIDNETIRGGYSAKWTTTKVSTRLGKNITFHTIEKDFKSEEEQYFFFAGLKEYSKQVPLPEIR